MVVVTLLLANIPRENSYNHWYIIVATILLRVFIGLWVFVDAHAYKFSSQRKTTYATLSMFIGEIVLPVYLVKSRNWKGAVKTAVNIFGVFIIFLLLSVLLQALILFIRRGSGV